MHYLVFLLSGIFIVEDNLNQNNGAWANCYTQCVALKSSLSTWSAQRRRYMYLWKNRSEKSRNFVVKNKILAAAVLARISGQWL